MFYPPKVQLQRERGERVIEARTPQVLPYQPLIVLFLVVRKQAFDYRLGDPCHFDGTRLLAHSQGHVACRPCQDGTTRDRIHRHYLDASARPAAHAQRLPAIAVEEPRLDAPDSFPAMTADNGILLFTRKLHDTVMRASVAQNAQAVPLNFPLL